MASCELMTNSLKRTRTGRALAVLAAVSLLAAACASDADDGTVGEPAPHTAQPAPTTGDVGDDAAVESAGSDATDESATGTTGNGTGGESAEEEGRTAEEERQRVGEQRKRREAQERARRQREADAVQPAALRQFGECGAALDYLRTNAADVVGPWGLGDAFGGELLEEGAVMVDEAAAGDFAPLQPGVDYSTSNVQEAGIDEPDVAKTDGQRLVVAVQNRIEIVDVTGPAPTLIATFELGDRRGHRLLLHGDRVLAFSTRWDAIVLLEDGGDAVAIEPEPGWGPTTEITEIDLSGGVPTIVQSLSIEGDYVSARMADGVVRLVTSSRPRAIPWAVPESAGLAAQERATAANRELIADTTIDHWLPRFALNDATGSTLAGGRLVSCDSVWAPAHYSGPGTLSVTTIDIASDGLAGPMDTTSIMSDASTVYASRDHLYVSTTEWIDWRVQPADLGNVTVAETEVHMFDIADPFSSPYLGSASVPGTVLNQYSMSEHEGHLRVATTTIPPWQFEGDETSESLVTVFAASGGGLSEVGQVGGLGIGERIFAVRYLGDIAAVVTFRQVDPLYLIDLSDPSAPEVRGELKITGYSAYLHPLGDDLLLGVGQEATDEGRTLGTQVSLFDIADLDRPERIAQWTAPGGHSEVEFNALAFLYWPAADLAVLPLVQYPLDDAVSVSSFVGAVAMGTADRTLAERARLSHAKPPLTRCQEYREIVIHPDGTEERGELQRHCWLEQDTEARVIASVVVGDRVYLASHKALESVSLESLERVSLLPWSG